VLRVCPALGLYRQAPHQLHQRALPQGQNPLPLPALLRAAPRNSPLHQHPKQHPVGLPWSRLPLPHLSRPGVLLPLRHPGLSMHSSQHKRTLSLQAVLSVHSSQLSMHSSQRSARLLRKQVSRLLRLRSSKVSDSQTHSRMLLCNSMQLLACHMLTHVHHCSSALDQAA